jgi:hypothetical protein
MQSYRLHIIEYIERVYIEILGNLLSTCKIAHNDGNSSVRRMNAECFFLDLEKAQNIKIIQ